MSAGDGARRIVRAAKKLGGLDNPGQNTRIFPIYESAGSVKLVFVFSLASLFCSQG